MIHKALFVVSGKDYLTLKDGSHHPTGYYASEFLEPYESFKQAGMQVDVATPGGVRPVPDPVSLTPQFSRELAAAPELAAPRRLSDVKAADYDVIFIPGGHAPVEDLPTDPNLRHLLLDAAGRGTLVAALCHGPAGLLGAMDAFQGRHLTSFSKTEEDKTSVAGRMQWELEPTLAAHGARYSRAAVPFEGYVVHDGNLVTGENPASAPLIAEKVLQVLHDGTPGHSVTFSLHRDVAQTPEQVWSTIGHFDTMPWHPGIESGKVEGAVRHLVARGGNPVFTEQLLESGPNFMRYQMTGGLPLHPISTLKVEPEPNGGTRITWEADMDTSQADDATVEAVKQGVSGFYQAGLEALAGGAR